MIDQMTIEKVLDAANIHDVVSQFVTLKRRGVNYVGLCPFHNEKTPSFYVSPSKGICKCFSCGKGGNAAHFIMEHEQIGFLDAVEWLAQKYGIQIEKRQLSEEEKRRQDERESLFIVNEFACKWFQEQLTGTPEGIAIGMQYFRKRGFRDDTIKRFQLGYCPENGDSFAKAALAKGFRKEYLIATGLCYERGDGQLKDRFWGRCIFPVQTVSGKTVAFGGRVLLADAKAAKVAKYVNSPESSIYTKRNELYGIYLAKQAITRQDRCFLVEGYIDVTSMFQSGIENVVASSGTSLTEGQIRLIHRFTDNITVLYDGDSAGIKASIRGIDMLLKEGMKVKVLLLPDGEDPDSFAQKHNATFFQDYIEKHQEDFIQFKIRLLLEESQGDPMKKAQLTKDITRSISVIDDAIVRAVYIKECSRLMQVDEALIINDVNRQIIENRQSQNSVPQNRTAVQPDMAPEEPEQAGDPVQAGEPVQQPVAVDPIEELRNQVRAVLRSDKGPLATKEALLARLLVRYGERTMCFLEDEQGQQVPVSVGKFITTSLDEDSIEFCHPVYKRILELYRENCGTEGFVSEKFFLSYPDAPVSLTAASLLEERYQLSTIFQDVRFAKEDENLYEITRHVMTDYQLAIVAYEIRQLEKEIQNPAPDQDITPLLSRYKEMLQTRNALAKELGDRVVTL